MLFKRGLKKHLFSGIFTILVISMLVLSGYAGAVNVALTTSNINIETDSVVTFNLDLGIDDPSNFFPLSNTVLTFTSGSNSYTCTIDSSNVVSGCNFLTVLSSSITGFDALGYGYGYGYGYGSGVGNGVVSYSLAVDVSSLPIEFVGTTVDVDVAVNGASSSEVINDASSFTVQGVTDSLLVANAKAGLLFSVIRGTSSSTSTENTNENNINGNLNLIRVTDDGVTISWSSSDATTINPFNGVVKRPSSSQTNKAVTLTATITKGTVSDTKTFNLVVLKESKSDTQIVNELIVFFTPDIIKEDNSDLNNVLTDLFLPTVNLDEFFYELRWATSNKDVITTTGAVSRQSTDKLVTLTATISKGSVSATKTFTALVKGTTDLNELAVNNAKTALTDNLVLNGNTASKIVSDLNLPTSLSGHDVSISWTTSNSGVVNTNDGVITRSNSDDKSVTLTATLSKNGKSTAKTLYLIVKKKVPPAVATNVAEKKVEVSAGQDEIVIDSSNLDDIQTIEIPQTVDEEEEVVVNLGTLVNTVTKAITLSPTQSITLTRTKNDATEIKAEIPQGTKIQGTSNWNGLITAPTVKPVSEVTISGTASSVIEVGFSGGKLTFDKATKLTVPGQAGKRSGYIGSDNVFHVIEACTSSQLADPNSLPADGECSTISGSDVIIWTKHFTQFVTFTPPDEICDDSIDNNLNGQIDEGCVIPTPPTPPPSNPSGPQFTFYYDYDRDGVGEQHITVQASSRPDSYASVFGDCRPSDPLSYPGVTEICNGVDNNCNGIADENEGITQECYEFSNNAFPDAIPGVGQCKMGSQICTGSSFSDQCLGDVGASTEQCDGIDNDCDGLVDENFDLDGDGRTSCGTRTDGSDTVVGGISDGSYDCNENNANIYAGAAELCNDVDDDCNGVVDDLEFGELELANKQSGVCLGVTQLCVDGEWEEPNYTNITNYETNELSCDGLDNDCDGQRDEGHSNYDGDSMADCVDPDVDGDGVLDNIDYVFGNTDDSDSNVPYSLIVAGGEWNGKDIREEGRYLIKFRDENGDDLTWVSYLFNAANILDFRNVILRYTEASGSEGSSLVISGINAPDSVRKAYILKKLPTSSGMVCVKTSDISDASAINNECNGADEILVHCDVRNYGGYRCEPRVRDGEDVYVIHGMNYYGVKEVNVAPSDFTRDGVIDLDDFFVFADNFGAVKGSSGYLPMFDLDYDNQIDYDDFFMFADNFGNNAVDSIKAKRVEITQEFLLANVNSNSESCNSLADEGNTRITGTDVGECAYGAEMCKFSETGSWTEVLSPIGPSDEICDGLDNDCDGIIDNDCSDSTTSSSGSSSSSSSNGGSVKKFYYDADGDRYGVADDYKTYSFGRYRALDAGDCNDNNVNANPGATEMCDGIDNNCDGDIDEGNVCGVDVDSDGDGYASFLFGGLDCNDNNANVNPGAAEICDGIDNNCDGRVDEGVTTTYYFDADDDGYGDVDATTEACSVPVGYVEDDMDCSDNNGDVNPDVAEQCNLIDDDCNGVVDDGDICVVPEPAAKPVPVSEPVTEEPVSTPSTGGSVTQPPIEENVEVPVEEPTTQEPVVTPPSEPVETPMNEELGQVGDNCQTNSECSEGLTCQYDMSRYDSFCTAPPEPAEKPTAVKGDFTGDGKVDLDDFFKFADYFGTNNAEYDLDGDGDVDYDDYFLFADQYGN